MTALSTDIAAKSAEPGKTARPCAPSRFILSLLGSALMFSSFALWLVPGSSGLPELSLIKLGLSVFMLIGGLCCIASTRPQPS